MRPLRLLWGKRAVEFNHPPTASRSCFRFALRAVLVWVLSSGTSDFVQGRNAQNAKHHTCQQPVRVALHLLIAKVILAQSGRY
eukprot:3827092-Amphidinium_carterae.1